MTHAASGRSGVSGRTDTLDCGNVTFGCCTGPRCRKLATIKYFVTVFSITALLQGATEAYLRISIKQAALEYGYDPEIIDWLLVSSGIFEGLCALFICYWAEKDHKIKWLGCLITIQSFLCMLVIVPVISHGLDENTSMTSSPQNHTCIVEPVRILSEKLYANGVLCLFFFAHLGVALGNIGYYTLGISYIDDNVDYENSPAMIGIVLALKFWGWQLGALISVGVSGLAYGWWLGWTLIGPLLLVSGCLIALFPKRLLGVSATDFNTSQYSSPQTRYLADTDLLPVLRRFFGNPVLLLNLSSLIFIQIGIFNYFAVEERYLKSRFLLPTSEANGLLDEWTSRLLSSLMRPLLISLCILIAGLSVAKFTPKARCLAVWNIIAGLLCCMIFISLVFVYCQSSGIAGAYKGKLVRPFCSHACYCEPDIEFNPVCPENSSLTYYSPCHAGCKSEKLLNNIIVYEDCTCGNHLPSASGKATQGACNIAECQHMWIIHQILSLVLAAVLSSCIIGKFLIVLRSVLPQDKAMALSLGLVFSGILVFVPGKFMYRAVDAKTCQFWNSDYSKCLLHETPLHGNVVNIISGGCLLIAIIVDLIVFAYIKDLSCYGEDFETYLSIPLRAMQSNNRYESMNDEEDQPSPRLGPSQQASLNQPCFINSIQRTQANYRTSNERPSDTYVSYAEINVPPSKANLEAEQFDFKEQQPRQLEYAEIIPKNRVRNPDVEASLFTSSDGQQSKNQRSKTPETDF